MPTRRQVIGSGAVALAALAAGGLIYESRGEAAPGDAFAFRVLDGEDRAILAAIVPAMIPAANVMATIEGFDTAVAGLTPSVQAEIAQLFTILRVPLVRLLATGIVTPWSQASVADVSAFLTRWRFSPILKLRAAYDALHQLTLAAWYGSSAAWPAIGYPGPPLVRPRMSS
jgi:hypothetical protein